ncbi:hypothetical protein GCM10009733_006820 [Nonomuraea maheshkhaliensis]|uniref:Uncharacterized protein n=1 Tax=Nonomuraea maheshkhaliensis TaxID=419590 RepID=A0ABN2EPY7_9ACTN
MPRSYALTVLVEHPFLLNPAVWQGPEPPCRWERLWAAAEDLADWENIVVDLSRDPGDFFDHLRAEQRLFKQLAETRANITDGDQHQEPDRTRHHDSSPGTASP